MDVTRGAVTSEGGLNENVSKSPKLKPSVDIPVITTYSTPLKSAPKFMVRPPEGTLRLSIAT